MNDGYIREERYIPVTPLGDRWAPRSLKDAEEAMLKYPVGGRWASGDEWDGVERIEREVRYVTEWRSEPATDPRLRDDR